MNDQAFSLRQLKKQLDDKDTGASLLPDQFLSNLARPAPFPAILLVLPDGIDKKVPPLQQWIFNIVQDPRQTFVWDQAGLLSAATLLRDDSDNQLFSLQNVEIHGGPMWVIPRIHQFSNLLKREESERVKFLKKLYTCLNPAQELWVTLNMSELALTQAIVHATDLVAIVVPDHPEAIIRCYEAVKSIHLSGFFAQICLLVESSDSNDSPISIFERIAGVSKRFLSLDLNMGGALEFGNSSAPKKPEPPIRLLLKSLSSESKDFFYAFAERFIYPSPGDSY